MPLVKKTFAPSPPAESGAESLRAKLCSGSPEERWTAARGLSRFADAVPTLSAALEGEANENVREAIFTSLARIASDESFAALLPYLRTDDAKSRTAALDALKLMPGIARAHLPDLLHDPDPDIRLLACDLARLVPEIETAELLARLAQSDPLANICAAAIDVLAEIGTAAQLPALASSAARFPSEPFLAFSARIAAEHIRARTLASGE
jgi:HEAT repeat protein